MISITHRVLSTGLIGTGALAWVFAGRPLIANPDLDVPLNPLGFNCSPYGEVIAMAMQGPIDILFDAGMADGGLTLQEEREIAPDVKADVTPKTSPKMAALSFNGYMEALLNSLNKASEAGNNPKAASPALKRYLRRQAEDKLRFAYQLDPSHYGNYNALHFFLTEPAVGTRPELTPSVSKLAEGTIKYCLRQDQDPRPALTAAAAATNNLQLMFCGLHNTTPKYTPAQMRQCLLVLDHCLARYTRLSLEWDATKQWERLSTQRIAECQERFKFIGKIREASEKTIIRLEAPGKAEGSKKEDIRSRDCYPRLSPTPNISSSDLCPGAQRYYGFFLLTNNS